MFDISQFETADTAFCHLKRPDTEEPLFDGLTPVGITFHAPGSEKHVQAVNARMARALNRGKRKVEVTPELLTEEDVRFHVAITKSFDGLCYPPAGAVAGDDLFHALYSDPKFAWVLDQGKTTLADYANFLTASPQS